MYEQSIAHSYHEIVWNRLFDVSNILLHIFSTRAFKHPHIRIDLCDSETHIFTEAFSVSIFKYAVENES